MCSPIDVACLATQTAATVFDSIALSAGKAAAEMIGDALTFWVGTETVNPDSPAVQHLQRYTVPVSAVILTGSMMVQGIRMMLSRKKDPLIAVAVDLIRYAVVSAIGLTTLALGVRAADAIAQALVDQGLNDYAERMKVMFGEGIATGNGFSLLLLALVGFLLGMLQWLLAFFRTAGLLVLAALLTLAAARAEWTKRIVPWALTLVAYKPMAAMIYVIGFGLMGDGQDVSTRLTGLMVLALAAVAMPAMMRFFAWSGGAASGGSGVGGATGGRGDGHRGPRRVRRRGWGGADRAEHRGERPGVLPRRRPGQPRRRTPITAERRRRRPGRRRRRRVEPQRQPGRPQEQVRQPEQGAPERARPRQARPALRSPGCRQRHRRRHRRRTGLQAPPPAVVHRRVVDRVAARPVPGPPRADRRRRGAAAVTAAAPESGPRTYGNWRRARGFGVGSLSSAQTYALFGAIVLPLAASYYSLRAGLLVAPGSLLVLAAMLVRIGGYSLTDVVGRRVRFTRARSAGWTELSGGLLTDHPRGRRPARADGADGAAVDRRRPRRQPGPAVGPPHRPADRGHPGQPGRAGPRRPGPGRRLGGRRGRLAGRPGLPAAGPPRRGHRGHRPVRRHHPARLRRRPARPGRARRGPGGAGRARRRHPGHQRRRGHPGVGHLRPGPGQPPAHRPGLRGGRGDPLAARARGRAWPRPGSRCWAGPASSG